MKPSAILYFYTTWSPFVDNDTNSLKTKYHIKSFLFEPKKKILILFSIFSELFFLLKNINSCKLIVVMFAGHHAIFPALFAKIFRKPCLIVSGGTDCVSFPSINYGNLRKGLQSFTTKLSFKLASHISPVHRSLIEYEYTYDNSDFRKQGIKYFIPNLKTPFTVINYGFDPEKWLQNREKTTNSFITVASWLHIPSRAKLKGVDLILQVAPFFPQCIFSIIGWTIKDRRTDIPQNVILYPFVSNEELKNIYETHEFYLQPSLSEGFPNAICEAMLCGCIPIGSNVGGLPDIIGDAGFILHKRDVSEFKRIIEMAVDCNKSLYSKKARARIVDNYPKDLRGNHLIQLVDKLIREGV